MGIAYNPTTRSWQVTNERTNYKTDYATNNDTSRPTNYPTNNAYHTFSGGRWTTTTNYGSISFQPYLATNLPTNLQTDLPTDLRTDYPTDKQKKVSDGWKRVCTGPWWRRRCSNVEQFKWVDDKEKNDENREKNKQNKAR